jgi:hypothetical protein
MSNDDRYVAEFNRFPSFSAEQSYRFATFIFGDFKGFHHICGISTGANSYDHILRVGKNQDLL